MTTHSEPLQRSVANCHQQWRGHTHGYRPGLRHCTETAQPSHQSCQRVTSRIQTASRQCWRIRRGKVQVMGTQSEGRRQEACSNAGCICLWHGHDDVNVGLSKW